MRCPNCNKFVSAELSDEIDVDLDVTKEGIVTGTVRIEDVCSECSNPLREAVFDVDEDFVEAGEHAKEAKHDLEVEIPEYEPAEHTEGRGRVKTFHGALVTIKVVCADCDLEWTREWSDYAQLSHMDEL